MYKVETSGALVRATRAGADGRLRERVGRTVILLGLCSLLTDISSEIVTAVLPIYLVATLGFTPLQYGIVDGIYQGASTLVRLIGGLTGDIKRRHKLVASVGYALSTASKAALAIAGVGFAAISAAIFADRTGKGLRTAPRDAMISLSVRSSDLGLAFGVHRAMDTAGAMLGPIVAFFVLLAIPGAFSTLFFVAFLFGLIGLAVLVLLVREPRVKTPDEPPRIRAAFGLFRRRRFRTLSVAAFGLGFATVSDGFVYLLLSQKVDLDVVYFPLLATGVAASYMLLAVPLGWLGDRVGRVRIMIGGYVCLLGVYVLLVLPDATGITMVLVLLLLGTYYAASDGVLMAAGSATIPDALRGSGLALLGTASSLSRLGSSIAFGALWTATSGDTALIVFGVGLALACAATAIGFERQR